MLVGTVGVEVVGRRMLCIGFLRRGDIVGNTGVLSDEGGCLKLLGLRRS